MFTYIIEDNEKTTHYHCRYHVGVNLINLNPGDLIQIVPVEVIGTVDIRSAALTVAQIC
ncbi:hypothetical protein HOV72_016090 [Bacillus albus]|uniref:hypothetical protein n=1 Tax=Bacillus albus TaxID=2026189 RepID=UPI00234B9ED0|nr:hypothetical protein [Bacillus albus]MDC6157416.1 hypothetical protein [Bacillus albus]MDD8006893.1 hypothetical protein [Bacillus albus]